MTTQNQNPNPNPNPNPPPSFSAAAATNSAQACAACKYQRRRCSPDCILSPFFPASRPKEFNNARRLFGVKNICTVAKSMSPSDLEKSAKSMIYEANIRAVDPVGGCYRIMIDLEKQIAKCESELHYCKALIGYFRGCNDFRNPNFENVFNGASSSGSGLSFGAGVGDADVKPPVMQLESSKTNEWRDSVALKKDDVEAIQPSVLSSNKAATKARRDFINGFVSELIMA